jgi:hypothetical protein
VLQRADTAAARAIAPSRGPATRHIDKVSAGTTDRICPTILSVIGTSQQQALEGLKALADAGIVRQISEGSYDRQFAAVELLDLVAFYEARITERPRRRDPSRSRSGWRVSSAPCPTDPRSSGPRLSIRPAYRLQTREHGLAGETRFGRRSERACARSQWQS